MSPTVSSVAHPVAKIAERALAVLKDAAVPDDYVELIEPHLAARESTGPAPTL
jgi:DNA-binding LacI/PurR family transcriptional regulator